MSDPALQTFPPARSHGWAWLVALLLLVLLPLASLFTPGLFEGDDAMGAWMMLAFTVPLATFFVLTLFALPRMRYELGPDALALTCGWMLNYRIPYAEITDVRRMTLTPSLWSSMRMPGLAMWGVPYADAGKLFMCATRMSRDILVLSTDERRYGITPADEAAFVAALGPMLRMHRRAEPAPDPRAQTER